MNYKKKNQPGSALDQFCLHLEKCLQSWVCLFYVLYILIFISTSTRTWKTAIILGMSAQCTQNSYSADSMLADYLAECKEESTKEYSVRCIDNS